MTGDELYWAKVGAFGQVAGAFATFLAVVVSLWIAFHGRRPRLRVIVGVRLILGQVRADDLRVLVFSVINSGQRPVHIRGVGWRTGWLPWGPKYLRRQHAVQITGLALYGKEPPYELQPGAEQSSYALMENVVDNTRKKKGDPFFAREWPFIGLRPTRIQGYAYTADGYSFRVKAEKPLANELFEAEESREVD